MLIQWDLVCVLTLHRHLKEKWKIPHLRFYFGGPRLRTSAAPFTKKKTINALRSIIWLVENMDLFVEQYKWTKIKKKVIKWIIFIPIFSSKGSLGIARNIGMVRGYSRIRFWRHLDCVFESLRKNTRSLNLIRKIFNNMDTFPHLKRVDKLLIKKKIEGISLQNLTIHFLNLYNMN